MSKTWGFCFGGSEHGPESSCQILACCKFFPGFNVFCLFSTRLFKEECNKKIEDLKTELVEAKRSQNFISTKYDKLKDEYSKLIETNKKQDAEIKKLKAESNEMSAHCAKEASKLDALEQ